MRFCRMCGTPLIEGEKNCNNCGEEFDEQAVYCPSCKEQICEESVFCEWCGACIAPQPIEPTVELNHDTPITTMRENPYKRIWRKLSKKVLAICLAVAILIFAAAIYLPRIFDNRNENQFPELLLYIKNNEINYTSLNSIEPSEITKNIYGDGNINTSMDLFLSSFVKISQDEKLIFYPDKMSATNGGYNLYYKHLKNPDEDGEKIASGVTFYSVNEDASKVFYIKINDLTLYVYDFNESEEIDENVSYFLINTDGSKVLYMTSDREIYLKDGKNEKEKIDTDASIVNYTEDFEKIYYTSNGSLYYKKDGEEKVEIDSEEANFLYAYKTGEIYYTKSVTEEKKLSDFVTDDKAEEDAQITRPIEPIQPVAPQYPSYGDYSSWDAYYAAQEEYNELYDAFNIEYNKYLESLDAYQEADAIYQSKCSRDLLRNQLKEQSTQITRTSLYYYNGEEATMVSENYANNMRTDSNSPKTVFTRRINTEENKLKLSGIYSVSDVLNFANSNAVLFPEICIAIKSNVTTITTGENATASSFNFNHSGNKLYFLEYNTMDYVNGSLYEIAITDDIPGEKTLYDQDVCSFAFLDDSDNLIYYKNKENITKSRSDNSYRYDSSYNSYDSSGYSSYSTCDFYRNKECIDTGVYFGSVMIILGTESLVYQTDYNPDNQSATLKLYSNGESKKIAEVVHDFYAVNDKCIAYLQNYSTENAVGDAYLYDGSEEATFIDDEVAGFINSMSSYYYNPYVSYQDYYSHY